jgi:hypothetical protein
MGQNTSSLTNHTKYTPFESFTIWVENTWEKLQEDQYTQLLNEVDESEIKNIAYDIYKHDLPYGENHKGLYILSESDQKNFLRGVKDIADTYKDELLIFPQRQGALGYTFSERTIDELYSLENENHEFAYCMKVKKGFIKEMTDDEITRKNKYEVIARLTLCFNPKWVIDICQKLAEFLVNSQMSSFVWQLKVLGPNYQGKRTDSAVIYLETGYPGDIERIAQGLDEVILNGDRFDHVPYGMRELYKGISTSEELQGGSSSHGESRALSVYDAVLYLKGLRDKGKEINEEEIRKASKIGLERRGFDPKDPSKVVKEKKKKIRIE